MKADTETVDGIEWSYCYRCTEDWDGVYEYAVILGDDFFDPAISASITGAITIPSTLGGYPVMGIAEGTFFFIAAILRVW